MKWAFHAAAAAVALLTLWIALSDRPPAWADPIAQVTAVAARSHFTSTGIGRLPGGETVLRFESPSCPGPMTVLVTSGLHRPMDRALGWLTRRGSQLRFVYGGREMPSSTGWRVPWLLRKAGEVVRLRRRSPWDSLLLVVALPSPCDQPRLDWTQIEHIQPAPPGSPAAGAEGPPRP